MGGLFLRLYFGIIITLVAATALALGLYQWRMNERERLYQQQVTAMPLSLLTEGVSRHVGEEREQWIAAAGRLLGGEIAVLDDAQIAPLLGDEQLPRNGNVRVLTHPVGGLRAVVELLDTEDQYLLLTVNPSLTPYVINF